MHWADVEANKLRCIREDHTISTGITPSGHIHVGNMREILTADALFVATKDAGCSVEHVYVADTFDPLRKVYGFLDEEYVQHVGRPLSEIPCPCGGHGSYADHFLEPFVASLEKLGIEYRMVKTHELYKQGMFTNDIDTLIHSAEQIRSILEGLSGRQLKKGWFPYNPKCSQCGKFSEPEILGYERPYVEFSCACGHTGKADIGKDDGKLPWRLDWPTRWHVLGVTCEPFGKDHATKGGSYETGKKIIEEILDGKAPHPVVYEWIQLKGQGAMSSSKGVVVKTEDLLKMIPPEVFRLLIMKNQSNKHIDFDTGLGILNLVDEYDLYERGYFGLVEEHDKLPDINRAYELAQVGGVPEAMPLQVPYRHLVNLVQISDDWDQILKIIERARLLEEKPNHEQAVLLKKRANYARYWANNFAPEGAKFAVMKDWPEQGVELTSLQIEGLQKMVLALQGLDWTGDAIHDALYNTAQGLGMKPKEMFKAVYMTILGQPRGPRLGYFLSYLDRNFVLDRLSEPAK
jgi:lysyl-tRNA synthetase class 1